MPSTKKTPPQRLSIRIPEGMTAEEVYKKLGIERPRPGFAPVPHLTIHVAGGSWRKDFETEAQKDKWLKDEGFVWREAQRRVDRRRAKRKTTAKQ